MTCSAAIRRTGPLSAGTSWIFFDMSGLSFSAVRVTEMAFATYESLPARIPRLFEDGSQVKTSPVSDSLNSARMNLSASMVCGELMTTLPSASCSEAPKDQSNPRKIMFESSSCDRPRPQGFPNLSLIAFAPLRRSSQVSGPFG